MKREMGLILQGGGALGAFEYGAVIELIEQGWQPKALTGVSIGAINAAAIAGARGGDIAASLHAMWKAITLPQVPWLPASQQTNLSLLGNPNFWRSRTDYLGLAQWTSLCDTAPMYETLGRICDFDQISDPSHMRIGVTATDLHSGGPVTFSNYLASDAQTLAGNHKAVKHRLTPSHIIASGSLPPGFPATAIDERLYWDGGLFSNTPIDALLNLLMPEEIDSLKIFVVDLFPSGDQPAPANLVEVQTRAMALQYQNRFWDEYGGSGGLQEFLDMLDGLDKVVGKKDNGAGLQKNRSFAWLMRLRALRNLEVIAGSPAAGGGDHDFSPYGVESRYQAGRAAAAVQLLKMEKRSRDLLSAA
jgi:NTE family protein